MLPFACILIMAMNNLQLACTAPSLEDITQIFGVPSPIPDDIDVPESCRHQNYCKIRPKNFPQEVFDNMFKDKNVIPQPSLYDQTKHMNRIEGDADDGCKSEIEPQPLYLVKPPERGWHYTVQSPTYKYEQMVPTVKCVKENSTCLPDIHMMEYTSFCKQSSVVYEILVASKLSLEKTITVNVTLPSCCTCAIKRNSIRFWS